MNAAKLMEDFCINTKELAFRRRLSGVVFKPPCAADTGNIFVVSEQGKTEAMISEGIYQRAERK
jgi:hypothetical protein